MQESLRLIILDGSLPETRPIYIRKFYRWYQFINGEKNRLLDGDEKIIHCMAKKQIIFPDLWFHSIMSLERRGKNRERGAPEPWNVQTRQFQHSLSKSPNGQVTFWYIIHTWHTGRRMHDLQESAWLPLASSTQHQWNSSGSLKLTPQVRTSYPPTLISCK